MKQEYGDNKIDQPQACFYPAGAPLLLPLLLLPHIQPFPHFKFQELLPSTGDLVSHCSAKGLEGHRPFGSACINGLMLLHLSSLPLQEILVLEDTCEELP